MLDFDFVVIYLVHLRIRCFVFVVCCFYMLFLKVSLLVCVCTGILCVYQVLCVSLLFYRPDKLINGTRSGVL